MKVTKFKVAYLALLVAFYFVFFSALPHEWYVYDEKITINDACVGDTSVVYNSERTPRWGMKGNALNIVIEFTDGYVLETTITRKADFIYEPGTTYSTWGARFDHPFEHVGRYGVSAWETIYPLPFIEIDRYVPPEERMFNVVNCV